MSRIRTNRNKAKLRQALGIRARLVLFAMIIVAPLMVAHIRSLEDDRDEQISRARNEFQALSAVGTETRRDVLATVSAVLKSSGYLYRSAGDYTRTCEVMRDSLHNDLPWLRKLAVASHSGLVQCTTDSVYELDMSRDVSQRSWFRKALGNDGIAVSDFFIPTYSTTPTLVAAYRAAGKVNDDDDAVIIAFVNLNWMSDLLGRYASREGIDAVLVDSAGTVMAAGPSQAGRIGGSMANPGLISMIALRSERTGEMTGNFLFTTDSGSTLAVTYMRLAESSAWLIATIDQSSFSAHANKEIRSAYIHLGVICLFILLGATVVAERLIIKPIRMIESMAYNFGRGDWSARISRQQLPVEFTPLIRALYGMAAQLRMRERELQSHNDRLSHMATIDVLSGLNNRRALQQHLDQACSRAIASGEELSLMMIDVDYFKQYNDALGHLRGDDCLAVIGRQLDELASRNDGFAARYGGEEFCLLFENIGEERAIALAEQLCAAVNCMKIPHPTSPLEIITVSIGIATMIPTVPGDRVKLLDAADAALYSAKNDGRNRVALPPDGQTLFSAPSLWPA